MHDTGAERHRDPLGVAGNAFDMHAQTQLDVRVLAGFRQQAVLQIRAVDHPIRRAVTESSRRAGRNRDDGTPGPRRHHGNGVGQHQLRGKNGFEPQFDEDARGIRRQLQAGADFEQPFRFFQNGDTKTACRERERGRQSADAGARNDNRA
jgi:hypothetical protein